MLNVLEGLASLSIRDWAQGLRRSPCAFVRRTRPRASYRVEALEPRWLLATSGTTFVGPQPPGAVAASVLVPETPAPQPFVGPVSPNDLNTAAGSTASSPDFLWRQQWGGGNGPLIPGWFALDPLLFDALNGSDDSSRMAAVGAVTSAHTLSAPDFTLSDQASAIGGAVAYPDGSDDDDATRSDLVTGTTIAFRSLSSAMPLPGVDNLRVEDSLMAGQSSNLYKIPIDSNTHRLGIDIQSLSTDSSVAETVSVYDPSGRVYLSGHIYQDPATGIKTLVLNVSGGDKDQPPTMLYVEVSLLGSNGDSDSSTTKTYVMSSEPYVMRVMRNPIVFGESTTPGTTFGYVVPASLPLLDLTVNRNGSDGYWFTVSTVGQSPATSSTPNQGTTPVGTTPLPSPPPATAAEEADWTLPANVSQPSVSVPNNPTPVLVATGPLPARSAAPLGGILADGDPVPPVDPHGLALADFALDELVPEAEGEGAAPPNEDGAVVAIRGPGGFPLLATALIADTMTSSSAEGDPTSQSDVAAVASGCVSPANQPTSDPSKSTRSRTTTRSRVFPALTFALAMGIGLMLPDFVAAFQTPSPKRPRLRLGMLRRMSGGRPSRRGHPFS